MVYLDKYNNPWATKEVYDDHVKRHASELNGHYLEEVRDAYQQVSTCSRNSNAPSSVNIVCNNRNQPSKVVIS